MSMYCEFLSLATESEYREYFIENYCNRRIYNHLGILVRFYPDVFDHAFFRSSNRFCKDKAIFCMERAKRMKWIKQALNDDTLYIYEGWDSKKKRYDNTNKVTLVTPDGYVVVLRMVREKQAKFITAYIIDDDDVEDKIKKSPCFFIPSS